MLLKGFQKRLLKIPPKYASSSGVPRIWQVEQMPGAPL